MRVEPGVRVASVGRWRLVYRSGLSDPASQKSVLEMAESQPWSRHPQTMPVRMSLGCAERELFLKVFHSSGAGAAWKNALRQSRAVRAWRMALELEHAGFLVARTIAAGEERRAGFLNRAFLLTEKIDGEPAHIFLNARYGDKEQWSPAQKRAGLREAAKLVRRFHDAGFVHGDLVATNIFVDVSGQGMRFFFMDNDRTRRYPSWLPQRFWKRNLIQLNRMPLAGVTLQDRMRFFKEYLGAQRLSLRERALARWLEKTTRRRRAECDGVDGSGDFRRLMRWSVELSSPRALGEGQNRLAAAHSGRENRSGT